MSTENRDILSQPFCSELVRYNGKQPSVQIYANSRVVVPTTDKYVNKCGVSFCQMPPIIMQRVCIGYLDSSHLVSAIEFLLSTNQGALAFSTIYSFDWGQMGVFLCLIISFL